MNDLNKVGWKKLWVLIVLFMLIAFSVYSQATTGPLTVHPDNPRYFTDGTGKAVYLTGSHNWNILINMENFPYVDFTEFLDYMNDHDHNFLRLWTNTDIAWNHSGTEECDHRFPMTQQRTGPGTATDGQPKFDLKMHDLNFTTKLRKLVEAAQDKGIYVSIMFFEGWWNSDSEVRDDAWFGHPYNPNNNINGLTVTTQQVHTMDVPEVVALQEGYVRNIIDTVNDMDNVLYEVANEDGQGSVEWQLHFLDFIRRYESNKPKQHPVGLTTQAWGTSDDWLFSSTADWISPAIMTTWNNENDPYKVNPPATDGSKIIILDTDHLWGIGGNQQWVWKSFLRGYNPIYMDPYMSRTGMTPDESILLSMGYTREYADKMDLVAMTPQDSLSSTGYCLANPGSEYLVYQPDSGSFSVELEAGDYYYEWFRLSTGNVQGTGKITGISGGQSFTPPFSGDAVLYLVDAGNLKPFASKSISQDIWTLSYADSEELAGEDGLATNAFDASPSTLWHTEWLGSAPPHPHEIQIDLGDTYEIYGFHYLPRQDMTNGRINRYEFYVSLDGSSWGSAVSEGNLANTAHEQEVLFQPVTGRFVKLRALSEVNGNAWTSVAEINVLGSLPSSCTEEWSCTDWSSWSACSGNRQSRTRMCTDNNDCSTENNKPDETETRSCGTPINLIGWWTMDQEDVSGGSVLDKSVHGNDAAIYGTSITSGRLGDAAIFYGQDDYLQLSQNPDIGAGDFAVSLWIRRKTVGARGDLITRKDLYQFYPCPHDISLFIDVDNKLKLFLRETGTSFDLVKSTRTIGTDWTHIAAMRYGTDIFLYINGNFDSQGSSYNDFTSNGPLRIGSNREDGSGTNGQPLFSFSGLIDEVRLYNSALTQEEIKELYMPKEIKIIYQFKDGKEEKVFDALEWMTAIWPHVTNNGK